MEDVLLKLSGVKLKKYFTISGVVLIVVGVFLIFAKGARNEGVMMYSTMGSGKIGGGQMFDADGQKNLFILGILSIFLGFMCLNSAKIKNKSYMCFYSDKMVGVIYSQMLFSETIKKISLNYSDIKSFEMTEGLFGMLLIQDVNDKRYVLNLNDIDKANNLLKKYVQI